MSCFAAPLQPERPSGRQRCIHANQVVGPARGCDEQHVERDESDCDEAVFPECFIADQPPQAIAGERDTEHAREQDHLYGDARAPSVQRLGLARHHRGHSHLGPAVHLLPDAPLARRSRQQWRHPTTASIAAEDRADRPRPPRRAAPDTGVTPGTSSAQRCLPPLRSREATGPRESVPIGSAARSAATIAPVPASTGSASDRRAWSTKPSPARRR